MIFVFLSLVLSNEPSYDEVTKQNEDKMIEVNELYDSKKFDKILDESKNLINSIKELNKSVQNVKRNVTNIKKNHKPKPAKVNIAQMIKNSVNDYFRNDEYTTFSLIQLQSPSQTISSSIFKDIVKLSRPTAPLKTIPLDNTRKWRIQGKSAIASFRADTRTRISTVSFPSISKERCNPKDISIYWMRDGDPKITYNTLPIEANQGFNISVESIWFREFEIHVKSNYGNSTQTCIPEIKLYGERYVKTN